MLSIIQSLGLSGVEAFPVVVEVVVARAMPMFSIVGLPDAAVNESRERVRSVFQGKGYPFPDGRITVNLAPADVRKTGALYDLPIFTGLLCAQNVLPPISTDTVFLGELSLSGELRPVNGVLPMLLGAAALGFKRAFIPLQNAAEAAVVQDMEIYAVENTDSLVSHLRGESELVMASRVPFAEIPIVEMPDFSEVKGQHLAKRAMEIAAAGGHNLLMIGPPGTGKSMLAKRLPSILPEMRMEEAIETTKVYSAAGRLPTGVPLLKTRPFRAPHHSITVAGLCGGGSPPHPGELSLAHNGVLFLDELPEFRREAMEALRQPLEDAEVTISRANYHLCYPGRVMLAAAMNPCPCGYFGHPTKKCVCTTHKLSAYLNRVSGPLLDRIDLHVEVLPVDYDVLSSEIAEESSSKIKKRVETARKVQISRFSGHGFSCNSDIPPSMLSEICALTTEASKAFGALFEKLLLSGRAYDRILKVARTIADLSGSDVIETAHIFEAVQYRSLDRKYWEHSG